VLELPVEEIAARADLELEQAQKVVAILKAEFEEMVFSPTLNSFAT